MIINIDIEQIHAHPENPRKDIGDVSELAESIKKNGIMQNLTVIPGHFMTDEEWQALAKEYSANPSEATRNKMNSKWLEDGYTLIIGHRRCAASRAAGLKELPCRVIEGMSRKEQIATMLEENMQRNDLTIYEQAQGFQLMLDLGETVDTIAQKTGFSKSTIHHRLNIAKLDGNTLKEKENGEFQLTLKDLYELEKIKDVQKRNEILKNARDSRDLSWRAQNAARQEKQDQVAEVIIKHLEAMGIKKAPKKVETNRYSDDWRTTKIFELDKGVPEEIKASGEYWIRGYGHLDVVRKNKKAAQEKEKQNEKERVLKRNEKEVKAVLKDLEKKRKEFVSSIILGKIAPIKDAEQLKENIWHLLLDEGAVISKTRMAEFFLEKNYYENSGVERVEADKKAKSLCMTHQMLVVLHKSLELRKDLYGYRGAYNKDQGKIHQKCYELLEQYGWSMTEEEQAIVDGNSDLYSKED